jgi:hypothetical protein
MDEANIEKKIFNIALRAKLRKTNDREREREKEKKEEKLVSIHVKKYNSEFKRKARKLQ